MNVHDKCLLGYHWEKETHPEDGKLFTDHQYGICIHKEFSKRKKVDLATEFEEHQLGQINFENNETAWNYNLSVAFNETLEKKLSGTVSCDLGTLSYRVSTVLHAE